MYNVIQVIAVLVAARNKRIVVHAVRCSDQVIFWPNQSQNKREGGVIDDLKFYRVWLSMYACRVCEPLATMQNQICGSILEDMNLASDAEYKFNELRAEPDWSDEQEKEWLSNSKKLVIFSKH